MNTELDDPAEPSRDPFFDWWHVAAWSSALTPGQPISTELMGTKIVLWRDAAGAIHAAEDRCPHRGTQLSLGTIENGCLVCPYHGWSFDHSGQCVYVPQLSLDSPIPRRVRLAAVLCEEKYAMIWICLGTPKHQIPDFPQWDNPEFRHVECEAYTWKCSAERMVENFMDFGHLGYLHDGLLGTREDLVVPSHHVTRSGHELHFQLTMMVPSTSDTFAIAELHGAVGKQTNTYVVSAPYTILLESHYLDTGTSRVLYFSVQPNSFGVSTGYCYQSRNFKIDAPDQSFAQFQALLAEQDRPIVESQLPVEAPLALAHEVHLPFDKVAVAYRRLLKDLTNHERDLQLDS